MYHRQGNNYLTAVLIHHSRWEEIDNALIENVISNYCVPDYTIIDYSSASMSSLMNYLLRKLDIKIKCGTLQPSIITGRTWNKIIIFNLLIVKEQNVTYTCVRVYIGVSIIYLMCRQLRFSLYSGTITTKALTMVVFLYYPLSLALWSILCLMPLA